jgi:2-keto-3-deoxy-L-rhamnonate aldolase RhmA
MSQKTLKQRIRNKEQVVGVSVPLSINLVELAAMLERVSCDFIFTDSQHSAFNEERLVAFCQTADKFNVPVHLRIKHTRHTYLIGNYLDLGPSGVEVPQVETESTVDEAVANFYYPPLGIRSWGGSARKGAAEHGDRLSYAQWWSAYGVLWLQLESVNAVLNARKFAKPGVDILDFGPVDLTFNIETYTNPPFRTVDDCVRYVAEQVADVPVGIGFRTGTPDHRERYAAMGVTVFLERPV